MSSAINDALLLYIRIIQGCSRLLRVIHTIRVRNPEYLLITLSNLDI